jgi:hypothetical protein
MRYKTNDVVKIIQVRGFRKREVEATVRDTFSDICSLECNDTGDKFLVKQTDILELISREEVGLLEDLNFDDAIAEESAGELVKEVVEKKRPNISAFTRRIQVNGLGHYSL